MAQATLSSSRTDRTFYTVNVRLLAGSLLVTVLAVGLGYVWYQFQAGQVAAAVLERAEKLDEDGKWGEASAYYQKYLLADPENTDVLVKLIEVQNQGEPSAGKLKRLNDLLYRTLGRLPEREDLRLMLAENLLASGLWSEAESEAAKLTEGSPEIARRARKVISISRLHRVDIDHTISAAETINDLISIAQELPSDHELALTTAIAIRDKPGEIAAELGDPEDLADRLIDQAVNARPDDVDALMARHMYRQRYSLPGAKEDLAAALEIEPENTVVLLASARSAISPESSAEDLDDANKKLRTVIDAEPANLEAYLSLAEVLKLQSRTDEAIGILKEVVSKADEKFVPQLALAMLQLESQQIDDAKVTLGILQRDGARFLARCDTNQRKVLENRLRLLRARIELGQRNPTKAIQELKTIYLAEDTGVTSEPTPEWIQACLHLAAIYQEQEAWDQTSIYWDAVLRTRPGNADVVKGAAETAIRAGQSRRALDVIDRFGRPEQLTEDLLVLRIQALLMEAMQLESENRNWDEFEHTVQIAQSRSLWRPEILLSQVERYKAESGGEDEALALLRGGEKRFRDSRDFWRGAVLQYAQLGTAEDRERALANYRNLKPSPLDKALTEALILAQRDMLADADKLLADAAKMLPVDQQPILHIRRVGILIQRGEIEKASNLANELLPNSTDLKLLRLGAELALATGDLETAQKWEEKLSKATANGADAQALKAKRLLSDFANLSVEERLQLADIINSVRSERSEWFEIISLAARYAELSGDQRQAVEDYRLAVALGDRRKFTLQQLVNLLYRLGRFDDASEYLAILASDQSSSDFVNAMGIELARKGGRNTEVVAAARQDVERHPHDASRRIYLANLLLATGEQREAEEVLRQASSDLPNDARVWLGLVSYLAKNNRISDAAAIVQAIESSADINAGDRYALLAQGYDLIGNFAAAVKNYEAAVQRDPNNIQLRLSFARSLRNRSLSEAISEYQKVLQIEPANRAAQSELAIVLASTGNPEDWARANQILEDDEPASAAAANSKVLLRALLLSRQGRTRAERIAKCQAARKLLDQHLKSIGAADAVVSRLMLAQVFEQEANLSGDAALLDAARDQLQQVVEGNSTTVELRAQFIEYLLRNADKVDDKEAFLNSAAEQLEELRGSVSTSDLGASALCTALAAQLSNARGKPSEAEKVVAEFAAQQIPQDVTSDTMPRLLTVGRLYTLVGNHAAAENTYRQILKHAPNAYVLVAQSLLEQDKRREAAQLCLDLAPDGLSPEMAQTLASILTSPEGEESLEFPEAEEALQLALSKYPDNIGLLQADAIRKASQEKYGAAIDAFKRLIEIDPRNTLALNNLATLLAENPDRREEALRVIQQAIQLAGRQPSLLDTKGTILLKMARADEAIIDLEEATAGGVADARYYLHLAAAYQLAQRNEDALKMLDEAMGFGLEKFLLTGDDRQLLEELSSLKEKSAITAGSPT